MDELTVLARSTGERGEIVLRRRHGGGDPVEELIVNGAFAMDSSETSSERELARLALAAVPTHGRMLIGGLGLGYTAAEALAFAVGQVDVVEIETALVDWARDEVTEVLGRLAAEPRIRLLAGDVVEVVAAAAAGTWDAVALDVDNGPDFLIHGDNVSLYSRAVLELVFSRLAPRGRLAIWCQGPAPELLDTLRSVSTTAAEHVFTVTRFERHFPYVIYTVDRPDARPTRPDGQVAGEPE